MSAEDSPSPTTPAGTPDSDQGHAGQRTESSWAFWRSVLLTLAVALGIRQFLLEARFIPSGSMLPGLQIQDRLLVEKISFRSRAPRRGEIVVFHSPFHFDPALQANQSSGPLSCLLVNLPLIGSIPGLQQPACDAYIKRVVAIPGDRVVVNPRGQVSINGQAVSEPYVSNLCPIDSQGIGPCRTLDTVVPPGAVLVLGDNRANSWDGRFWPGGAFLPQKEIIGRAFYRFWPLGRTGPLGDPDPLSEAPAKAGAATPSPAPAP
ncbi:MULTISPECIES: signal peptidase I [unclassified Synechococcus]|uniref:signal peptidase I n=1 Tax=Synechococcales TaxID=1890424 RepID=UPI002107ADDF|nr:MULTISPECIES: signal peptidase I [unclassified Synechococcus]